jgi:methylated-DNA-[protein]-cysteine S-methyltransferase
MSSHLLNSEKRPWTVCESPIGPLTLVGGPRGLRRLYFPGHSGPLDEAAREDAVLAPAAEQLAEYFAGRRRRFDLALDLDGTPFQHQVWAQLLTIPYGATRSYGTLAAEIGRTGRARAVGAAVGRTPVPIIVPCHRALGANGRLTGYLGGLPRKRALLDLEAGLARLTEADARTGYLGRWLTETSSAASSRPAAMIL